MKKVLVTGGAGFIGSHTVVELAGAGYQPIIIDDFSNSEKSVIKNLEKITGQKITYYEGRFQDTKLLEKVFKAHKIGGVIHFAAYKIAPESVNQPLKYHDNNVAGFISLLRATTKNNIRAFIFSSSAAVYGMPPGKSVTEETPSAPISPYGWSKHMDEVILADACNSGHTHGIALRYFNAVGAHDSGLIGEPLNARAQNLVPVITRAARKNKPMIIFGDDYPTPDGTCLRDYIHVVDLARAHVAALKSIDKTDGFRVYNIGTGKPTSVLELIKAFESVSGIKVPYEIGQRRPGDPPAFYALVKKAELELGWKSEKTIMDSLNDVWRWQQNLSPST